MRQKQKQQTERNMVFDTFNAETITWQWENATNLTIESYSVFFRRGYMQYALAHADHYYYYFPKHKKVYGAPDITSRWYAFKLIMTVISAKKKKKVKCKKWITNHLESATVCARTCPARGIHLNGIHVFWWGAKSESIQNEINNSHPRRIKRKEN